MLVLMMDPLHKTRNGSYEPGKNVRKEFRLSLEDSILLKDFWKSASYPDPYNHNKFLSFRSEQEFLNYVVRCVVNSKGLMWYLISNGLNPNFSKG